jgi:hypothetical protein
VEVELGTECEQVLDRHGSALLAFERRAFFVGSAARQLDLAILAPPRGSVDVVPGLESRHPGLNCAAAHATDPICYEGGKEEIRSGHSCAFGDVVEITVLMEAQ